MVRSAAQQLILIAQGHSVLTIPLQRFELRAVGDEVSTEVFHPLGGFDSLFWVGFLSGEVGVGV